VEKKKRKILINQDYAFDAIIQIHLPWKQFLDLTLVMIMYGIVLYLNRPKFQIKITPCYILYKASCFCVSFINTNTTF
jgi:hypothetical protein